MKERMIINVLLPALVERTCQVEYNNLIDKDSHGATIQRARNSAYAVIPLELHQCPVVSHLLVLVLLYS